MKLLFAILSVLFLFSCNHLEEGAVLGKHYEPARSYVTLIPMRVGKSTILIPYTIYDNEDFVLTVEGTHNGELIHETVYVTKDCYDSHSIGSHWNKTETCTFSDGNNTKERK